MWLIDFLTAFSEIIAKVKHFSLQSTAVITKTSNSILAFQTHNLKVIRNHKFQLSWIFHRQKLDPNATVLHNFSEEKKWHHSNDQVKYDSRQPQCHKIPANMRPRRIWISKSTEKRTWNCPLKSHKSKYHPPNWLIKRL